MAANVLFKQLTQAQWEALSSKDNGTFYRVVQTGGGEDFYQGSNKLNNAQDIADALYANLIEYEAGTGGAPDKSVKDALDELYTAIGEGGGVAQQIEAAINALDGTATIASKSGNVVTIKAGITEADGIVDNNSSSDIVLGTAAVADFATTAIQEESSDDSLVSAAQVASFVAAEIAGLEGAMHFRGVITRQTGETDAEAIARVITSPESGDVVVMSDNAKEYVYDGTAWREVGDETEFVKKTTTIAGVDLQDNITKTELLTALNVADGAQVNTLESVKVNGSALTIDANKAVDVLVAEGSTNGTVAVNGSDISIHGLDSAAYAATTDFDAAGAAAAVLGTSGDAASAATVYGAKAYADSLATNYDPAGSASTAESNAESYADGLLTWTVVS